MDRTQSQPTARTRIFMSYRRQETEYPAGWLFERLAEHFHGADVFKDIDSIELGDDFVEAITAAVESCDVLLALIGDRWLTITNDEGGRRIDDPDDFVRIEIAAALSRNVRVVPILVYGAKMPRAHDLPDSFASLVRRQALELSANHFDADVTRLLKMLDKTLAEVRARPTDTESSLSDVAATSQAQQALQGPQDGPDAIAQREIPTTPPPFPGLLTGPSDVPGGRGEADRGVRARGRGVPVMVIAAMVIAIVLGGIGVWLWRRGNAGPADTGSTSSASRPASHSSSASPSPTATRPLFVWQSVPGPTTQALKGATAAAYNGKIWVAGGMDKTVRVYDPATRHWQVGPPLPTARSHGVLVSDRQRLYYIGGISGSDIRGLRTVYRLDSPTGAWTEDSPLPQGRFSGAAVWDGHRIVFGGGAELGSPRTASSDVWALASGGWARIASLPSPREHLAAAADGSGTVWFLGGADVSAGTTGLSAELDVLRGSSVVPAGSLPKPVQGLSAVWTSASGVCAIGGSTSQPNATSRPVATVTCLGGRPWPRLPQATYLPASTILDNTVYVVAGTAMFLLNFGP
jgi:hypothetical protein